MSSIFPYLLIVFVAFLVFASGWRICPRQNAIVGGTFALLLFLLHPAILFNVQNSSPWDALFVMLFVSAWLWMEHWSLFMRSWVLAGLFAFGLWVGSAYVLWGLVAMVPWVIFNRRPLPAVGSLFTVFFGGLILFSATWGVAWFIVPGVGHPLFTQWIRWGGLKIPPSLSLPWFLLTMGAVLERYKDMLQNRRSDASVFMAVLLGVSALFGSSNLRLGVIALSAPLITRLLIKREFLFHRGVRWVAGLTFVLTLTLVFVFKTDAWISAGTAMLTIGIIAWWYYGNTRLPWSLAGEAACVGAYLAESFGTLLH